MPLTRAFAVASIAASAVTIAAAGPAAASDAGLRSVVKAQEAKVKPLAVAFKQADVGLATASDTNQAAVAAGALRSGLREFKLAVAPVSSSSATGKRAKKLLLKGIRAFDVGLVGYQKLLGDVRAGASKASLKATFTTLNKRIAAAAKNEAAALKLLNVSV